MQMSMAEAAFAPEAQRLLALQKLDSHLRHEQSRVQDQQRAGVGV